MDFRMAVILRTGARAKIIDQSADKVSVLPRSQRGRRPEHMRSTTAGGYTLERQRKGAANTSARSADVFEELRLKTAAAAAAAIEQI